MRRKNIAELARHRHRIALGASDLHLRFVKCALRLVQALPERQRHLQRRDDTAALHPRGFEMRAADVPADDAFSRHRHPCCCMQAPTLFEPGWKSYRSSI